jgi:hypothetical protein
MFEHHEEFVRRRRAAGQLWHTNVGVTAPVPNFCAGLERAVDRRPFAD